MSCREYHILHRSADDKWHLAATGGGDEVSAWETQDQAVADAQRVGRAQARSGQPVHVAVHSRDGGLEREYRFGEDPHYSPG